MRVVSEVLPVMCRDKAAKRLIEPESIVPNQLPNIVVCRVHNAQSPGPQYHDFDGVPTLKFFKAPDSRNDRRGPAKKL